MNNNSNKNGFNVKKFFLKDGKSMLALAAICVGVVGLPLLIAIENHASISANAGSISGDQALSQISSNEILSVSSADIDTDSIIASGPFINIGALSDYELGEITPMDTSIELCVSVSDNSVSDNSVSDNGVDFEYNELAIANVSDYVNVRKLPSSDAEAIGKIYSGSVAHILGNAGGDQDWFFIESGNVMGYIKAEYFISGEDAASVADQYVKQYVTVLCDTLNVRKEASSDSPRIGYIKSGESLPVIEIEDGWIKIAYSGDKEGYVSADFVSLSEQFTYARTIEEDNEILVAERERDQRVSDSNTQQATENLTYVNIATPPPQLYTSNAELRQAIINYAMQYLGNRYVSGGSTLAGGTDCSGFTSLIYADFGYSLSRTTTGQYSSNGRFISYEEAQPGDIICYAANGVTCSHVALYIGNGQIIHSSTPRRGVIIANISSCGPIIGIKNVID